MTKKNKIEIGNENKLAELEQKIGELTLGWQRTQADFVNYKKQVDLDRQKLIKGANASVLEAILPVLDNFQLAAKHVPAELEGNNWTVGIKQIEKQLESILASEGLSKIETVGIHFNPHLHEAIDHVESDRPEGEIVEEIAAGYLLNGETLRPAKVKISKGK